MAVVNFPSGYVLNRTTPIQHHSRVEDDPLEGGAWAQSTTTNLDYITIPVVYSHLSDSEAATLKNFLDTNAANDIVYPLDSDIFLGIVRGGYSAFKTGRVWTVKFEFYGLRFVV